MPPPHRVKSWLVKLQNLGDFIAGLIFWKTQWLTSPRFTKALSNGGGGYKKGGGRLTSHDMCGWNTGPWNYAWMAGWWCIYYSPIFWKRHLYCLTTCFSRAFVSSWCVYYFPPIRKNMPSWPNKTLESSSFSQRIFLAALDWMILSKPRIPGNSARLVEVKWTLS